MGQIHSISQSVACTTFSAIAAKNIWTKNSMNDKVDWIDVRFKIWFTGRMVEVLLDKYVSLVRSLMKAWLLFTANGSKGVTTSMYESPFRHKWQKAKFTKRNTPRTSPKWCLKKSTFHTDVYSNIFLLSHPNFIIYSILRLYKPHSNARVDENKSKTQFKYWAS